MAIKSRYIALMSALLVGCYGVEISETIHPDTGVVTVDVVLPDLLVEAGDAGNVTLPEAYTVELNGEIYTLDSDQSLIPAFLDPGEYTLTIYSTSDGTSYEGGIATMEMDGEYLRYDPDIFLYGSQQITVTADSVIATEMVMTQVVGALSLNLAIVDGDPDSIVSAVAEISGLAGAWDCLNNREHGDPVKMSPPVTQGASLDLSRSEETKAEGADNDHFTSTMYTMGTNGTAQSLTMTVTFKNGAVESTTSDMSSVLSSFNSDKTTPVTLSADLSIPTSAGVSITISEWEDGGSLGDGDTY